MTENTSYGRGGGREERKKNQTEDYFKYQASHFYEKMYCIKQVILPTTWWINI